MKEAGGRKKESEMQSEDKWKMKNGEGKGVHDNGKRSNLQILS